MIITLITIGLLLLGVVLICSYYFGHEEHDFIMIAGLVLAMSSFVAIIAELGVIAVRQGTAQNEYDKAIYQKEVLEYRIENEGLTGNELLYHDITNFNNVIREAKYWHENPWTSWFNSGKVASIEYIEIGKDT